MNDLTKNILVFIVIIVVLLSVVNGLSGVSGGQPQVREYSEFLDQVRAGQVEIAGRPGTECEQMLRSRRYVAAVIAGPRPRHFHPGYRIVTH